MNFRETAEFGFVVAANVAANLPKDKAVAHRQQAAIQGAPKQAQQEPLVPSGDQCVDDC
jgi:hypothetical protein